MVKLNLADTGEIPEDKKSPKGTERESSGELDFTLETMEEIFEGKASPEPEMKPEETPIKATTPVEGKTLPTESGYAGEEEVNPFEDTLPRKRLFIILGILAGLLVIALLIYFLFLPQENIPLAEEEKPSPVTEKPQVSPQTQALQQIASENRALNQFLIRYIQSLYSVKAGNVDFSMMIITPERIFFSVVAETREDIARFRMQFKQQFPGSDLRLESIAPENVGGSDKLMADFSIDIATQIQVEQVDNVAEVPSGEVRNLLMEIARTHDLRVRNLKTGTNETGGEYRQTYYYLIVSGAPDNIFAFLSNLSQQIPMISFSKISIYSENSRGLSSDKAQARLNLIYTIPE